MLSNIVVVVVEKGMKGGKTTLSVRGYTNDCPIMDL